MIAIISIKDIFNGKKRAQTGNALFLILIAVALFAALSYAVTSSGRGNTSIDREKLMITVSKFHDQLSLLQTAVQRMRLAGGMSFADIKFCEEDNPPNNRCDVTATNNVLCTSGDNCLFAPEGGGVPPIKPIAEACTENCYWRVYLRDWYDMGSIGTQSGSYAKSIELIEVTEEVCAAYNRSLGLPDSVDWGNPLPDGFDQDLLRKHRTVCWRYSNTGTRRLVYVFY